MSMIDDGDDEGEDYLNSIPLWSGFALVMKTSAAEFCSKAAHCDFHPRSANHDRGSLEPYSNTGDSGMS